MGQRKLYLGPLTDSRRWDHITLRSDDVLVVTPPKSGTTWMQTIVALLFSGDPDVDADLSVKMPWVDIRLREVADLATRLEAMRDRRGLKSHTPLDGLPMDGRAQYLCVFRHPLDVHFSFRAHLRMLPMPFFAHLFPQEDPEGVTFRRFLDCGAEGFDADAVPLAHILQHYATARALSDRPNVTMFHYRDMTRDLSGTFAQVAKLLGITHPPEVMDALVQAARFDNMKAHADRFAPAGGKEFFDSGTSGKWQGQLSEAEVAAYDTAMEDALSHEARAWLEWGSTGAP